MTASNDITGDLIKTKLDSVKNYRDNYDMIFKKEEVTANTNINKVKYPSEIRE